MRKLKIWSLHCTYKIHAISSSQRFWAYFSTKWRDYFTQTKVPYTNVFITAEKQKLFQAEKGWLSIHHEKKQPRECTQKYMHGQAISIFFQNEIETFTVLSLLLQRMEDLLQDYFFCHLFNGLCFLICSPMYAPLSIPKMKQLFLFLAFFSDSRTWNILKMIRHCEI